MHFIELPSGEILNIKNIIRCKDIDGNENSAVIMFKGINELFRYEGEDAKYIWKVLKEFVN